MSYFFDLSDNNEKQNQGSSGEIEIWGLSGIVDRFAKTFSDF